MPTAFVAGATGYTGREVVRVLRDRGARTVAHVRPDSPQLEAWRDRFAALGAEVDTTPWEPAAMTATLTRLQPTHIFSLLGTTRARGKRAKKAGRDPEHESYAAVDYGLTALLIRAAIDARIQPRFVYLSAMGVSSSAPGAYYQARWKAEELLRSSGLPFEIARPAFISGPDRDERRPAERIGAEALDGVLDVLGFLGAKKLRDRYRSVTGAELAETLVWAALEPAGGYRVLEAADLHRP